MAAPPGSTARASTRATWTRLADSRVGSCSRGASSLRSSISSAGRAAEGVQSLLLEGGPTLAHAFLEADLVDKLVLFVAPTISGTGPRAFDAPLTSPRTLARPRPRQIGGDVLLEAYVHLP